MFTPSFWCTIIIANHALVRHNVPREIIKISTSEMGIEDLIDSDLESLASPRELGNGKIAYLSNGIVSWINCLPLDYQDIQMEWKEEIDFLLSFGLQFGNDMIEIRSSGWGPFWKVETTTNKIIECNWINMLESGLEYAKRNKKPDYNIGLQDRSCVLWVDEKKMFKGYNTRTIKT